LVSLPLHYGGVGPLKVGHYGLESVLCLNSFLLSLVRHQSCVVVRGVVVECHVSVVGDGVVCFAVAAVGELNYFCEQRRELKGRARAKKRLLMHPSEDSENWKSQY
jgi:hypothetical protein